MGYILSKEPKIKYAPAEIKVFKIISAYRKPITTKMIVEDFYFTLKGAKPFHADNIIGGTIRTLRKKIALNKEPFILARLKVSGKPVEWALRKAADKKAKSDQDALIAGNA